MINNRKKQDEEKYHGADPIRSARAQSNSVNRAWLKNGESLTIVQRIGFTAFSLLFVGFGLYFTRFFVLLMREGDFMAVIYFGITFTLLSLGLLGLRNVMRF